MTPGALLFLLLSWSVVLGLTGWSFHRILKPRTPAVPGAEAAQPDQHEA